MAQMMICYGYGDQDGVGLAPQVSSSLLDTHGIALERARPGCPIWQSRFTPGPYRPDPSSGKLYRLRLYFLVKD